jgi:hypothetical protein
MDKILIQIPFKKKTEDGLEYNDALYFSQEEYAALTEGQIEEMKQTRFNNWLSIIQNPIITPEPTEEQVIEERVKAVKEALAKDEPVINGILDATLVIAPLVNDREGLRTALLNLQV